MLAKTMHYIVFTNVLMLARRVLGPEFFAPTKSREPVSTSLSESSMANTFKVLTIETEDGNEIAFDVPTSGNATTSVAWGGVAAEQEFVTTSEEVLHERVEQVDDLSHLGLGNIIFRTR